MKFRTRNNLKSEKGSTMIMALAVILMLTSFATLSLMTSVANVQISSTFRNWSKDYYSLDRNASDRLNQLSIMLQNAESDAQKYMTDQDYLYDPTAPYDPLNPPPPDFQSQGYLQGTIFAGQSSTAQSYINTHWRTDPDIFERLYYYFASTLLNAGQYTSPPGSQAKYNVTYQDIPMWNNPSPNCISYSQYQSDLFAGNSLTGNLAVIMDTNDPVDLGDPVQNIPTDTVKGKEVSVKVNVLPPTYNQVSKDVALMGNPIWANAITAAGNIDFSGTGTSTINGDVFSADLGEPLIVDDNSASKGIYSSAHELDINGNVYSKGNLHITGNSGNGSTVNVKNYTNCAQLMDTTLKNNIFSSSISDPNNNLFFDTAAAKCPVGVNIADYTEGSATLAPNVPLVYKDNSGGNVYCNSLAVEGISNGNINVQGNVITYNDIRMNGLSSEITVEGNNIGVNSTASTTADPNANSSVINNTAIALPPSTASKITLEGKFIVPGTAWAEYTGDEYNGDSIFDWVTNKRYYQTAESISAKSADIFSAYMAVPLSNLYDYPFDQFTTNQSTDTTISSFYLMRGINKSINPVSGLDVAMSNDVSTPDENKDNIFDAKRIQLDDYLNLPNKNIVTNINTGPSPTIAEGYSLGAVILHQGNNAFATVYEGPTTIHNYTSNELSYTHFESSLANIFIAKTMQIGTKTTVNNVSQFAGFVDKSVVIDNGSLRPGISSVPSGNINSFTYISGNQDLSGKQGLIYSDGDLNLTGVGTFTGIIYCAGNLTIQGSGTFTGAIICEGNVTVSDNSSNPIIITYDEATITNVLQGDLTARLFFAPGAMGKVSTLTAPSDGAYRTGTYVKRYQVVEWKEVQS